MRFAVSFVLASIASLAAACSSSSGDSATGTDGGTHPQQDGGNEASPGDDASADANPMDGGTGIRDGAVGDAGAGALGALMPQVVQLNANSVIANPKVMPILYENDPNRADVEAFVPNYAQSTAWGVHTAEYGVGALTVATVRHIPGSAPATITDAAVTAMLQQNLGGTSPAWGAPDPSTVYAFFFPKGTIVNDGSGGKSCTDYDGYHSSVAIGNVTVPYAISVQCPGFDGMGITDLQQLTIVASHEIVEAVTDPIDTNPGYAQADNPHAVWGVITGGETGDMCAFIDGFAWKPSDMNYSVQRMWSNAAAKAGHDPCVGGASSSYYQTVPTLPDSVTINGPVQTKGLKVARGSSGTLTLTVYADTPSAGPFVVTIDDYSSVYANGNKLLSFTVPSGQVNAGDQIQVTVNALGRDSQLGQAAAFVVNTKPVGGGATTYFYGLIGE